MGEREGGRNPEKLFFGQWHFLAVALGEGCLQKSLLCRPLLSLLVSGSVSDEEKEKLFPH